MNKRTGLTLLETVVVIAIIAILVGLFIPAVQRVRESAIRAESQNKLKQLVLATHHFASTHRDRLPTIHGDQFSPNRGRSLFRGILPYLEQIDQDVGHGRHRMIAAFISPMDPTFEPAKNLPVSSYVANAQLFDGNPRLPVTLPDGPSNTIAFAEQYSSNCQGNRFVYYIATPSTPAFLSLVERRATFADAYYGDHRPERRVFPTWTFAVAPSPDTSRRPPFCNDGIPTTPHVSGMLVAIADGSVRILSPGMSPYTFWSSVSPSGGEILGPDW